jgi:acetate kinase
VGTLILALNCGSSSLKFGAYQAAAKPVVMCEGEVEEIGKDTSSLWFRHGETRREQRPFPNHAAALQRGLELLHEAGVDEIQAVGHRIVHGGIHVREHQRLTNQVTDRLRAAVPFAPLHLPAALDVIESVTRQLHETPQVVCLDTAFHRSLPDVSRNFALPAHIRERQVERFGFHGLSLESIMARLDPIPPRLVVAHLGNGSSITAIRDGKSVDTSMGLTPAGGVMMGTRSGDLDPGVLIYLVQNGYVDADKLMDLLEKQSGLAGISGTTSDVRTLLAARAHDMRADLALRMFTYQVRKTIAAMAAALGGLDTLIFSGGIGEHAASLREDIHTNLSFLGSYREQVLPAEEDLQIARITAKLTEAGANA